MTIPILAPNLLGQAAQQRHDVFNTDRQNAENRAAAKEAFKQKMIGTFVDAGLQAAQDFGMAAYKESTEGARKERELADTLKTTEQTRGLNLFERNIDQPRKTPLNTAPLGGFKTVAAPVEAADAGERPADETSALRRDPTLAREVRRTPPAAPELAGITKPYESPAPAPTAPETPPAPTAQAPEPPATGFFGRPKPPPETLSMEPSDVAFRKMAEGRAGLLRTPQEVVGTSTMPFGGTVGSLIDNASQGTAQRIAALTPDPTWTPEQVAIQQALWRKQAAAQEKAVADALAARQSRYDKTIKENWAKTAKAGEVFDKLTPSFGPKGRITSAPAFNLDLGNRQQDDYGNISYDFAPQSVRGGGGGGGGGAAKPTLSGGIWDTPVISVSTKPSKGSDVRGSIVQASVNLGKAWTDINKTPDWHGWTPSDVKLGNDLIALGKTDEFIKLYEGVDAAHLKRIAATGEGKTTTTNDLIRQANADKATAVANANNALSKAAATAKAKATLEAAPKTAALEAGKAFDAAVTKLQGANKSPLAATYKPTAGLKATAQRIAQLQPEQREFEISRLGSENDRAAVRAYVVEYDAKMNDAAPDIAAAEVIAKGTRQGAFDPFPTAPAPAPAAQAGQMTAAQQAALNREMGNLTSADPKVQAAAIARLKTLGIEITP